MRAGESLPIEPKVYDLLLFLIERRERTVSKEELQDAVWPNVIVTESALTRCVMKARQLVGDDAKRQAIIKTVQKGGYRFVADVECTYPDQQALAQSTASRERVSIAVLPFANLNGASDQDYLADGLTQDVSTDLSRNAWMFVVSHRTMQSFAGNDPDHGQIAAELGVQYVVEGSVRRSGDKIRVTASLVDAHTGVSEWSERYDREVEDLFEIQDDIGAHIVSSTGSHVRRAEGRRAERADPAALDVWGLLHRGMSISWSRFSRESNGEAEALYRQALQIEPDNARAKAFLANSIAMKISNGWSDNLVADQYEAWTLANAAKGYLPDDALVIGNVGHLHTCLGKAAEGAEILRRACELDPNSVWCKGVRALALTCSGRAEEAILEVTQALRLSPRDAAAHWFLATLAWAYLQQRHFEDAAREAQRSINAYAGWPAPWATLAVARMALGQEDDAVDAIKVCHQLSPDSTRAGHSKFLRYAVRDDSLANEIDDWLAMLWPADDQ